MNFFARASAASTSSGDAPLAAGASAKTRAARATTRRGARHMAPIMRKCREASPGEDSLKNVRWLCGNVSHRRAYNSQTIVVRETRRNEMSFSSWNGRIRYGLSIGLASVLMGGVTLHGEIAPIDRPTTQPAKMILKQEHF